MIAPDVQHAHPAAPAELKRSFTDFLKKFQTSARANGSGSSSGAPIYQEYWEAPSKYWNSRVKTISEEEIDAVLVGVYPLSTPSLCSQGLSRAEERRCTRLHTQFTPDKNPIRIPFNPFPRMRASVSPPPLHPSPATAPSVQPPHPRCLKQSQFQLLLA
jgi:small subunit ribosomal protein YMR-31